ncbi:MAG: hypothetical protein M3R38_01075 [Actinomycetota bacterium]|nr:hypothetical protein [Actinomycetota bacterium]
MSRGLGATQRRVLAVLKGTSADEDLPVVELKSRVGGDRSNTRRAVLALASRGLIKETTVGGERRVRRTFWGALASSPPPEPEEDPPDTLKALKAKWAEEARERAAKKELAREKARLEALEGPFWYGYAPRVVRHRHPSPTQRTILAVLWGFADPLDSGLPIPAVKAVVRDSLGTDRSNVRRAIRSLLLLTGQIEVSEDGERIRLAERTAFWFCMFPPISPEPIDEERTRAILRAY